MTFIISQLMILKLKTMNIHPYCIEFIEDATRKSELLCISIVSKKSPLTENRVWNAHGLSPYKKCIQNILDNGIFDKNPRPKYKDGSPAYSKFITHYIESYDISKNEFPIIILDF